MFQKLMLCETYLSSMFLIALYFCVALLAVVNAATFDVFEGPGTAAPSTLPTTVPSPVCLQLALGDSGESCSATCAKLSRVCKEDYFAPVTTQQDFYALFASTVDVRSGEPLGAIADFCTGGVNLLPTVGIPAVQTLLLAVKGMDTLRNSCSYPASEGATVQLSCDAELKASQARRFCPCVHDKCDESTQEPPLQFSWYLSESGDSCDATCEAADNRYCIEEPLAQVRTNADFLDVLAASSNVDGTAVVHGSAVSHCNGGINVYDFAPAPAVVTFLHPSATNVTICSYPIFNKPLNAACNVSFPLVRRFCGCKMYSPTAAPTTAPSTRPTVTPSAGPSATPTCSPSASPSLMPSAEPTASPSASPTAAPTLVPTDAPSVCPSALPTRMPTAGPTLNPSARPTVTPSTPPTALPSALPTTKPTTNPTAKPTTNPSAMPTVVPTVLPTARPTPKPSTPPTGKPTAAPSTAAPTRVPTAAPTRIPTLCPSASPSAMPTAAPTRAPTTTAAPSTSAPSVEPTASAFSDSGIVLFGSDGTTVSSVVTLSNGDVVVAGLTTDTLGAARIATASLPDAYMRLYSNRTGVLVWTKQFGTQYGSTSPFVTRDASDNIVMTYRANQGTIRSNSDAIYTNKYNASGFPLLSMSYVGTNTGVEAYMPFSVSTGVAVDNMRGFIYMAGERSHVNTYSHGVYLKYNAATGALVYKAPFVPSHGPWTRYAGITTDSNGYVWTVGTFYDQPQGANTPCFMVNILDPTNAIMGYSNWKAISGTVRSFGRAIAAAATTYTYSVGEANGVTEGGGVQTHAGGWDVMVTKQGWTGPATLTRPFNKLYGGSGDDFATAVAVDNTNDLVYVAGYSTSSVFQGVSNPATATPSAFLMTIYTNGVFRGVLFYPNAVASFVSLTSTHVILAGTATGDFEGQAWPGTKKGFVMKVARYVPGSRRLAAVESTKAVSTPTQHISSLRSGVINSVDRYRNLTLFSGCIMTIVCVGALVGVYIAFHRK